MSSTRLWNPVNSLTILRVSISTIRTTMSSHIMARSPLSRCRSIDGADDGSTSVYSKFVVWKSKNCVKNGYISQYIYNELRVNQRWASHLKYWQWRRCSKNRLLVQLLICHFVSQFQNKIEQLLQADMGPGCMFFAVFQIAYSTCWSGQPKNWLEQNYHMQ